MGSTAESQRVPEQNLHESRQRLYKHRWSYNQESTEHLFISIYMGNLEAEHSQRAYLSVTLNCQ